MLALILFWILRLYLLVLLARVVLSWVPMMNPTWVPRGVTLVLVEGVFAATDPPLKAIRKVIKPVRVGGLGLDLAVLVLFLVVQVGIWTVRFLPF